MQLAGAPPGAGAHAGLRSAAHHSPARPWPQSMVVQLASKVPLPDAGAKPGCMWKSIATVEKGARMTAVAVCQLVLHDVLHATA